jgi:hypothetical protein
MANKISFPPKKKISLAEQVMMMKLHFPDFTCRWKKNVVCWVGYLQPTVLSCHYKIKILHQLHRSPAVYVLEPKLQAKSEESIPHTYPGERLCLYHPKKLEWSQQMYVAQTIVPWTSLWLFYYERWHMTGDWLGGGEHPSLGMRRRRTLLQLLDE